MPQMSEKEQIFEQFFKIVMFEGWCDETIKKAVSEAGFDPVLGLHYFPHGVRDIMDLLAQKQDEALATNISPKVLEKMRVHERITYLTKERLMLYLPYRDAIASYGVHLMFPKNATQSLKSIARTVDLIWFMAGDKSTDHNYYTKRGLLGVVYVTTAIAWMNDKSENFETTWAFLDRRIENVLSFGKALSQFGKKKAPTEVFGNFAKAPKRFFDRLKSRDI